VHVFKTYFLFREIHSITLLKDFTMIFGFKSGDFELL
jgi:WD40 repeat protein